MAYDKLRLKVSDYGCILLVNMPTAAKFDTVQNESPTLKLFYYHTPATKTCCVSCITLLYISCIIHHYMTLYNNTTFFNLLLLTECHYYLYSYYCS